jgi:hypothetical protein
MADEKYREVMSKKRIINICKFISREGGGLNPTSSMYICASRKSIKTTSIHTYIHTYMHTQVIEELDEKKNQALKTTYAKVSRDFTSIFTTLLPNAKAKLEPPEVGSCLCATFLYVCKCMHILVCIFTSFLQCQCQARAA